MSGMTYSVLVLSEFSPSDSGRVTGILREMADAVTETRRGRHWDCAVHGIAVSLQVRSTKKHDYDYEDDLLKHGLLFDDAPEAFLITCGVRNHRLHDWCSDLGRRLTTEFDGVDCGFGD